MGKCIVFIFYKGWLNLIGGRGIGVWWKLVFMVSWFFWGNEVLLVMNILGFFCLDRVILLRCFILFFDGLLKDGNGKFL